MKKVLAVALLGALLCVPSSAMAAKPTTQTFVVNNRVVDCVAYNIGGYNYFKLRDVVKGLSDTGDRINVRYDKDARVVEVVPGEAYVSSPAEEGNTKAVEVPDAQVVMGHAKVKINGVVREVESCNISGYNF